MAETALTVWTIGNSTRRIEDFIELLKAHNIESLVDVRHSPRLTALSAVQQEQLAESLRKPGLNTTTCSSLEDADELDPILPIPPGETKHFAAMPTTWRQSLLRKELLPCSIWRERNASLLCAPKRFGGDVIAA